MSFFIDRLGEGEPALPTEYDADQDPVLRPIPSDDESVVHEDESEEAEKDLTMEIPSDSEGEINSKTISTTSTVMCTNIQLPEKRKRKSNLVSRPESRLRKSGNNVKSNLTDSGVKNKDSKESRRSKSVHIDTEGMFFCGPQKPFEDPLIAKKQSSKQRSVSKTKSPKTKESEDLPSKMEIPEKVLQQYEKGSKFSSSHIKQAKVKHELEKQETRMSEAVEKAAKMDLFLSEQPGYIEAEDEELPSLDQDTIQRNVDITNAEKRFDLSLKQFGPYKVSYTRNGRYLLIGGKMGHIAAFDWNKKSLCSEINVMETVNDICWLHNENMFAVAQKRWVYIYDRAGVELHALRQLDRVKSMQFLPYHFLLATMNDLGFLSYLDVSMGKVVSTLSTGLKGVREIIHNPQNAVIFSAHPNGVVNLWAPSSNKPLVKMACHRSAIATMAIDKSGNYLATCGIDRRLRIFDLRTFAPVHSYKLNVSARSLDFSQKGLLAAAFPRNVDIFKGTCGDDSIVKPYLTHRLHRSQIGNVEFCPYEDVLGIGHQLGVSSILVPGSGEPNFDALEVNPFATTQQRKEAEIKSLLDKIQPEMISLENNQILRVHKEEKTEIRDKDVPPALQVNLKKKAKGRSKSMKKEQRKSGLKEEQRRKDIQEKIKIKRKEKRAAKRGKAGKNSMSFDPLDRFKTKSK